MTYRYRSQITPTSWVGWSSFSICRNERLICLVFASLAELRRATLPETGDPPVPSRTAESPYTLLAGDGAVIAWLRHAAVAERAAVQSLVSIAYPMLSLNFVWVTPRGLGHLA